MAKHTRVHLPAGLDDWRTAVGVIVEERVQSNQILMIVGVSSRGLLGVPADPDSPYCKGKLFVAANNSSGGTIVPAYSWRGIPTETEAKPGSPIFLGPEGSLADKPPKHGWVRQVGVVVKGGVVIDLHPDAVRVPLPAKKAAPVKTSSRPSTAKRKTSK